MTLIKSIRHHKRGIIFSFGFILFAFIAISQYKWKFEGLSNEPQQLNTNNKVEPSPPITISETDKKPFVVDLQKPNDSVVNKASEDSRAPKENSSKELNDKVVENKPKPRAAKKPLFVFDADGLKTVKCSKPYKALFKASKNESEKLVITKDSDISELPEMPARDPKEHGLVGISNRGNSCYADSVIQILYRVPAYRKLIANFEKYRPVADKMISDAAEEIPLAEQALAAYTGDDRRTRTNLVNRVDGLKKLIVYLKKRILIIEGLNYMFYQLQSNKKGQAAKFSFGKAEQCMQGDFHQYGQEDADEFMWQVYAAPLNFISPGQKLRHFELKYERIRKYIANDGFENPRHEDIIELDNLQEDSLRFEFPKEELNKTKFTLKGFLDGFFGQKISDYKFKGETVAQGKLEQTMKIKKLPEIVPILLNRADYDMMGRRIKIQDGVDMPAEIDFAPYCKSGYHLDTKYRLKMFIYHIGSTLNSGHYVAFAHESDGNWYELNDSQVKLIPKQSTQNGYFVNEKDGKIYIRTRSKDSCINDVAYIYFYERKLSSG